MSRWLKSVNTLLDNLDGQVENVIEEQAAQEKGDDDFDDERTFGEHTVDSILAKRGLSSASVEDAELMEEATEDFKDDDEEEENIQAEGEKTVAEEKGVAVESEESIAVAETVVDKEDEVAPKTPSLEPRESPEDWKTPMGFETVQVQEAEEAKEGEDVQDVALHQTDQQGEVKDTVAATAEEVTKGDENPTSEDGALPNLPKKDSSSAPSTPKRDAPRSAPAPAANVAPKTFEKEYKAALAEAREAQKEARTLRRHVVALNEELESAEAEMKAQRTELERAAERIEKDRTRNKEEKEKLTSQHEQAMKALKAQHEQALKEQKARADQQLEESRKRMREIEERRMQEGGDWTKELEVSVQREQEAARRMSSLEDEKSTLLAQISTLQAQQAALENRVESLSQTADNAMEREREAEDRLDSALSMHARQLTQRQAREAELERTIADLGAALVVARNKELERLKSTQDAGASSDSRDAGSFSAKFAAAEEELETIRAQLSIERERAQTLHQELRDLHKERTEEVSALHARQLQSDRRISDMALTISRLQASQRDSSPLDENKGDSSRAASEKDKQIQALSEQVIRHQDKLGQSSSEIKALKSRLQDALNRAEQAEAALAAAESDDNNLYDTMERAPSSEGIGMKRRGRRRRSESYGGTIRSSLNLNNPGQEKFGKAIDAVDTFSVETGKYLRYNPLARGIFLLYLILIHLWSFVLLIWHAHNYETVHADAGSVAHGPHSLMQQSDAAPNP